MLNYNCPKIPSPKKIKEGIKNFLKIYPKYTNYYNNLYNSKNLAGASLFGTKNFFWPKCHKITVYSNCSESITDAMCGYFKEWIEGTSLKLEVVKDKSKADLRISIGKENAIPGAGGYTSSYGILNLNYKGFNFFIGNNQDELLQMFINDPRFNRPINTKNYLLHEFGHFLGFIHEHSRSDRPFAFDIKKLKQDIKNPKIAKALKYEGDFNRIKSEIIDLIDCKDKSAYDFKSIMQYHLLDMKDYIICNKGVNCEDLFKENIGLSDTDKSYCNKIYSLGKDCPTAPPPPPFGQEKCEDLQAELEKYDKAVTGLKKTIFDKRKKLATYEKLYYDIPEDREKNKKLIDAQNSNLLKLELEKFDNQYEIKKIKSHMEKGKCLIKTTTEKPKTRTENCEFLLNLEKTIESLLSFTTTLKEKINSVLETDIYKEKLKSLDAFIKKEYIIAITTYLEIDYSIKRLNELISFKFKKQQEVLIKESKGFSPIELGIEDVFKDLRVSFNNKNFNKINNTLKSLISKFESSIKELTSLKSSIPELKIKYCPKTTTQRPITTPQSTSTPRPVFVSKS
jgi:hypothetical protein